MALGFWESGKSPGLEFSEALGISNLE